MAQMSKLRKTERIKHIDGTYDVEFEEVSRTRVYPEDEVVEILTETMQRVKQDMDVMGYRGSLYDPFREIAEKAMEKIKLNFDISIKPKSV